MLDRLSRAATDLFPRHRILLAYAFGSRISGRPRPDSNLDVAYYVQGCLEGRSPSNAEEMSLASRLSEAVGVEVDLRDFADAPLELRGRVLEEGVRIFDGESVAWPPCRASNCVDDAYWR
jgi:predicted nucleotidyltransferase